MACSFRVTDSIFLCFPQQPLQSVYDPRHPGPKKDPKYLYGTKYLEGQGDLVSRLITRITRVTIWVIGVINLVTKSP